CRRPSRSTSWRWRPCSSSTRRATSGSAATRPRRRRCPWNGRARRTASKPAEAAFSHLKGDDIYALALEQGLVMLDTEGSSQKWRISFGNSKLDFNNLNGRLAVESRGDRMSALLLDGSAELKIGSMAKKAQIGQEVVFSREGTVIEQKVETQKKLARLD